MSDEKQDLPPIGDHEDSLREPAPDMKRRRFLVAGGLGAISAGAAAIGLITPFVSSLAPTQAAMTQGPNKLVVDLKPIKPGQMVTFPYLAEPHAIAPVVVVRRTPEMLASLIKIMDQHILRDPLSQQPQQPPYATNIYRSRKPEWLVMFNKCTHLCCVPQYWPEPRSLPGAKDWWLGGFHCPCHGSVYDLAGRVIIGSPAPQNMAVPDYHFEEADTRLVVTGKYGPSGICIF
ncbi:ubiquinol-cytochrome c reductase iron-sulfur subunit [Acidihalobacter ferrooxydans]|uniref:Ubiquinol-cytochrome c reductase iron-sulfur subunit n=1 Tax=Acidihalobacter ferrooxydans TaxID=1765967 RepID=A0A1P8UF05_9GAMM|nr:ubiquinol-cytochrome c reductase iron-sulfur subunit [Acidihalobacter ferrooxydans]APZ42433.1 ubiquinol-cytochrome c reductase iron-sulfur subunit [Acidihalobacter ferrooxydans]